LERPDTLQNLNCLLEIWIEEHYHKSEHRSLAGISPRTAFTLDTRPLSFVDAQVIKEAFTHTETRIADKTGCVNFEGRLFEAGMHFAGKKVTIMYDPAYKDQIEIKGKDGSLTAAKPIVIGSFCGTSRAEPEADVSAPEGSRLLNGLKKENKMHRTSGAIATSFRSACGNKEV